MFEAKPATASVPVDAVIALADAFDSPFADPLKVAEDTNLLAAIYYELDRKDFTRALLPLAILASRIPKSTLDPDPIEAAVDERSAEVACPICEGAPVVPINHAALEGPIPHAFVEHEERGNVCILKVRFGDPNLNELREGVRCDTMDSILPIVGAR